MSDEREVLVREFPVDLVEGGDGRTIEARIVPYDTPARVVDLPQYGGDGKPYLESWARGAFDKQARAMDKVKVWLNFEHEDGLRGIVGHGAELDSRPDALYGTFRVHTNADGDKALQMVRDGLLTGISLEAVAVSSRVVNGVVHRMRAHLDKVALCRRGAFEDAQVLAVREQPEGEDVPPAEEDVPPAGDDADDAQPAGDDVPPAENEGADVSSPGDDVEGDPVVAEALARMGFEPLVLKRAVTRRPWDGSPARFTDEEYLRSALICREGDAPPKERCSLPVLEPNGDLNSNALGAAAGRINQLTNVTPQLRSQAARKLLRLYRQAGMEPPQNIVALASR